MEYGMEIGKVPAASVAGMLFSLFVAVIVPIALLIIIKIKTKAKVSSFFLGSVTFITFALILESLMHQVVFNATGDLIKNNTVLLALYGGFAAALFEETGRFIAMKFVMKNHLDRGNALMFGAGHGGVEAIAIVGFTSISNIVATMMVNSGQFEKQLAAFDTATAIETVNSLSVLWTTDSSLFFLSALERIIAITLHICLSLFVYRAVKNKDYKYLGLAYALHMIINSSSVLLMQVISETWTEVLLLGIVICLAVVTFRLFKDDNATTANIK